MTTRCSCNIEILLKGEILGIMGRNQRRKCCLDGKKKMGSYGKTRKAAGTETARSTSVRAVCFEVVGSKKKGVPKICWTKPLEIKPGR